MDQKTTISNPRSRLPGRQARYRSGGSMVGSRRSGSDSIPSPPALRPVPQVLGFARETLSIVGVHYGASDS